MKKFLMVFLVILMVTIPTMAYATTIDDSVESTITLLYGEPEISDVLLMNVLSGEDELPNITALYLFVSEEDNVIQYLDESGVVYSWIVDNTINSLEGLDSQIDLFNQVDMVVFMDFDLMNIVMGSKYETESGLATNTTEYINDITTMYLRAL